MISIGIDWYLLSSIIGSIDWIRQATKYKGFCAALGPHGKSRSFNGLLESTKKNWVSHAFLQDNSLKSQQKCWHQHFSVKEGKNISSQISVNFTFKYRKTNISVKILRLIDLFLTTFPVPVTFFSCHLPSKYKIVYLALVLRAHYAICRYMLKVWFQYNYRQITELVFQLEDVNSYCLVICWYSGVPGLSTDSLDLMWSPLGSRQENFASISSVVDCVNVNPSTRLNHVLHDAQKMCALTIVGTILKLIKFDPEFCMFPIFVSHFQLASRSRNIPLLYAVFRIWKRWE